MGIELIQDWNVVAIVVVVLRVESGESAREEDDKISHLLVVLYYLCVFYHF